MGVRRVLKVRVLLTLLILFAPTTTSAKPFDLVTCLEQMIQHCEFDWRAVHGSQSRACDDRVRKSCLAADATVCFEIAIQKRKWNVGTEERPKRFDLIECLDRMKWDCREPFMEALDSVGYRPDCPTSTDAHDACETAAPAVCWQFGVKKGMLGGPPGR